MYFLNTIQKFHGVTRFIKSIQDNKCILEVLKFVVVLLQVLDGSVAAPQPCMTSREIPISWARCRDVLKAD